ncbi:MAG: hypothetical protein E6J34_20025 [Chloroflexi bacterium]|nr:MAG: hypothetical protein E6J34_20015 [Chloroflexota bacterium]TMC16460.1 MAG: hypothetical protein E6J34_20025 [Chloroflexota bacterium]
MFAPSSLMTLAALATGHSLTFAHDARASLLVHSMPSLSFVHLFNTLVPLATVVLSSSSFIAVRSALY